MLGKVSFTSQRCGTANRSCPDYTTGRVMASISGMLPTDILVTRDGETFRLVPVQSSEVTATYVDAPSGFLLQTSSPEI
jgi:hypothetical protein